MMSDLSSPAAIVDLPSGTDDVRTTRPYRVSIVQPWTAIGGKNRCTFCDGLIGHLDLDYEVETGLGVESIPLHFHGLCYYQSIIDGLCNGRESTRRV